MKTLAKYVVLFFITLAVAGFGTYFSITLVTDSASEIIVPQLSGNNIVDVLETLTNMGLNPKLRSTRFHENMPRYHVTYQDPAPGTVIKKGRDVILDISKGRQLVTVPDLRQVSLEQSQLLIENSELQLGSVSYAFDKRTGKGGIITHYPGPFSKAVKGRACDLLISLGPAPVPLVMPGLLGKHLSEGINFTEKAFLNLKQVSTRHNPMKPENSILEQVPKKGNQVSRLIPISLIANTNKSSKPFSKKSFQGVIPISFTLPPGFLKKHVHINAFLFGTTIDLFNAHVSPGKNVCVLIPAGIQTKVDIFIDDQLIKTRIINPWNPESEGTAADLFTELMTTINQGEFSWEL